VKRGDSVQYDGKSWSVEGFNSETGDVVLATTGKRTIKPQEFAELNPGRELQVGERYSVRRSSGEIEEGWKFEGTRDDGSLIMTKENALRVEAPRADVLEANPTRRRTLERVENASNQRPVTSGELDSDQMSLRDGPLELGGKRKAGMGGHEMRMGRVQQADGSYREILFHKLPEAGDGTALSEVRIRKEMAAYQLNKMLGFDNGFPLTASRDIMVDGQRVNGWIQDASGETFEHKIRELARERFGGRGSTEDVSRLIKEDPELRRQVEQAFVERLIYGDWDNHALNYVIVETPVGVKVQSIDLDHAFGSAKVPGWVEGKAAHGVNSRLHADFSEQPLSEGTLGNIRNFVENYDTPAGRQQLADLGLKPQEIDGMLARARWLADEGKFPKATNYKDQMKAEWEAAKQAEEAKAKPGGVRGFFKRFFGR
jgi:hypothetical protein